MAFWNKAVDQLRQMVKPHQEDQPQLMSNRADGGFSGYQPKVQKKRPEQTTSSQPLHGFDHMMPGGVDPMVMQQFQQVGGQTGSIPPQPMQQAQPMMGAQPMQQRPMGGTSRQQPVAPMQNTGWQRQMQFNAPQPQPLQQHGWQQSIRFNPSQVPPQQPAANWNQQSSRFAPQQPVQQAQPMNQQKPVQRPAAQGVQGDGHMFYMPGSYVTDEGNAYSLVMRVAQITGVSSCFWLIEFMQNREAVIVNAEQITDVVEADRCMDLLCGAAYAMNQNFTRISGKQIYLITPANVQVQPYEALRRMGEEDIDRRWPGAQVRQRRAESFSQNESRHDDFASGFGQQASRPAQPAYNDYGGFGMRR